MIKIKVKFRHIQHEMEYSTDCEIEYIKNSEGDFIKKDNKIYKEKIK